ncbi:NAD(P)H-dependent oxidoreductase [uncultured Croceitalea sp.]|uniref:NAD(P)H-dependent oxidoreductase n=1 Tax=uncultured Croceitalea sp. TaxID=1798908 RepID=UPI00374EF0E2
MKVLIVHAHENPNSFCSTLANQARTSFETLGHTVELSDLYLNRFNPVGGKHDFQNLSEADYYKYATEQLHAHKHNAFVPELQTEMEKLVDADLLIFNFPLWWFDMPAILKGWVDRVLAYGFAYGGDYGFFDKGRFKGKQAFLCVTTGSPAEFYTPGGAHGRTLTDILKNIHQSVLGLIGFTVLPNFEAYGVSRISNENRTQILVDYQNYIKKHFT